MMLNATAVAPGNLLHASHINAKRKPDPLQKIIQQITDAGGTLIVTGWNEFQRVKSLFLAKGGSCGTFPVEGGRTKHQAKLPLGTTMLTVEYIAGR